MTRLIRHPFVLYAALGLLGGLGVGLILYATPQGLSLSDDSIAYVAGARSLLDGQGYREAWLASNGPVTHFPPGFSAALALIGLGGLDPLRGTRFLNSILFGANATLLGILGWRMTKSWAAGILLELMFLINASLLRVHAAAMSEPLYLFLSLASFWALSLHLEKQKTIWMVLTGVLVAGAYLTRYAGLALLATILVVLIVLGGTWRKRLVSSIVLLAAFLPFTTAWGVRNRLLGESATNRIMVFHPLTPENIETGIYNFSVFFIPLETWRRALIRIPNLLDIVVLLLAVVILIWIGSTVFKQLLRHSADPPEVLSFSNGLYILGYMGSILTSMLLFDASTKFKLRILSPVYVSLLLLLVFLGWWIWQRRSAFWRGLVVSLTVFILGISGFDTSNVVSTLRKGGQGYASFQWYDSGAMDFLRSLPEGTRIYTNQPGPVYLYTGRPCYVLPDLIDPVTALPRERYEEGVAALQADVLSGEAVLALFKFGSEEEDVQSVYIQLAEGLNLAHDTRGDKVFTAFP